MNNKGIAVLLGVMCFLLTVGICIQINTVGKSYTAVGRTKTENDLRDSVLRFKEKYDNIYERLSKKEIELETLREKATRNDEISEATKENVSKYSSLLGFTELVGKGLVITIKDADNVYAKLNPNMAVVHDGDLLEVVNALKNAGAEAISINNQRITNSSSITCIGNVIKINGEKVSVPYVINAIGLPEKLYGSITMPGGYIKQLEDDGIQVSIDKIDKETIVVPKYDGIYKFEYAENVE